jgi:hypothetical protein
MKVKTTKKTNHITSSNAREKEKKLTNLPQATLEKRIQNQSEIISEKLKYSNRP